MDMMGMCGTCWWDVCDIMGKGVRHIGGEGCDTLGAGSVTCW